VSTCEYETPLHSRGLRRAEQGARPLLHPLRRMAPGEPDECCPGSPCQRGTHLYPMSWTDPGHTTPGRDVLRAVVQTQGPMGPGPGCPEAGTRWAVQRRGLRDTKDGERALPKALPADEIQGQARRRSQERQGLMYGSRLHSTASNRRLMRGTPQPEAVRRPSSGHARSPRWARLSALRGADPRCASGQLDLLFRRLQDGGEERSWSGRRGGHEALLLVALPADAGAGRRDGQDRLRHLRHNRLARSTQPATGRP
jgi:hypothetical protein